MENVGILYDQFIYCKAIWYCYGYLVYFMAIRYNFSSFGTLYEEKSGNPAHVSRIPLTWHKKSRHRLCDLSD
jgi:hypothetical protein